MHIIYYDAIVENVAKLCIEANYFLGEDMLAAINKAKENEESPMGQAILGQLLDNAEIASREEVPMCQDTGVTVVFLEIGQEVQIVGGYIYDAINEGVAKGYKEGYLRKSVVGHPLARVNTKNNTPAIIHTKIVPGEKLKIAVVPKGGGSENMSAIRMFPPAAGVEGVKKFIIDHIKSVGPNACPPLIVGVGIGGNFEKVALMAKEALLRPVGQPSPRPEIAKLEAELLQEINELGIGPQGMGGRVTALAVHIEIFATHIASLPVAINLNCHANRHKFAKL